MPDCIIKENLFDPYKRKSELEDIPDDFVARMMRSGGKGGELNPNLRSRCLMVLLLHLPTTRVLIRLYLAQIQMRTEIENDSIS